MYATTKHTNGCRCNLIFLHDWFSINYHSINVTWSQKCIKWSFHCGKKITLIKTITKPVFQDMQYIISNCLLSWLLQGIGAVQTRRLTVHMGLYGYGCRELSGRWCVCVCVCVCVCMCVCVCDQVFAIQYVISGNIKSKESVHQRQFLNNSKTAVVLHGMMGMFAEVWT